MTNGECQMTHDKIEGRSPDNELLFIIFHWSFVLLCALSVSAVRCVIGCGRTPCVHPPWLAAEASHARDAGTAKSWRTSARGCGTVRIKFEARNDLVAFLELPFFYLRAHT